jgi:hypothetical protein
MRDKDEDSRREDEEGSPEWINPFGLASLGSAALAVFVAALLAWRWLTLGLAALGGLAVFLGFRADPAKLQDKDRVWLTLGGILNAVVVLLVLFAPTVLNAWWGMDNAAPRDFNAMMIVRRTDPLGEGKPISAEDCADAYTEAIRQEDVVVSVESVRIGSVPGRSGNFLIVFVRLANRGERILPVEPFDQQDHQPKLTDDSGQAVLFVEPRKWVVRPRKAGPPLFEPASGQSAELAALGYLDYQLVFAAPPTPFRPLKLEIPASTWGRSGECRIRISQLFSR